MRLAFLGTPAFAVHALEALAAAGHTLAAVVCQPDRPAGRGQALREPAVKVWARGRDIAVMQPEKVRDGKLAAALERLRPDALVVAAYGRILGPDLLTLAPQGAVNVHASLLPRYRGAAPIQWALAEGERETGITIMQMDEGLDTGDILLQRVLPIASDDTGETLCGTLARLGGEALVECLSLIEAGRILPVRQDPSRATLAPILEKEHGRIDWAMPAARLLARLRAFSPWPGAWTTLEGRTVKILTASEEPPTSLGERAGSARGLPHRGIAVRCGGDSAILVTELQPEGKRPRSATDFLNGLKRDAFLFGT